MKWENVGSILIINEEVHMCISNKKIHDITFMYTFMLKTWMKFHPLDWPITLRFFYH
jgi:hypothetical protein